MDIQNSDFLLLSLNAGTKDIDHYVKMLFISDYVHTCMSERGTCRSQRGFVDSHGAGVNRRLLLATGAGNGPLFLLEPNALLTSESEQCFLSTLFETGTSFR